MKMNTHPKYKPTRIKCACGHVFEIFSTKDDFNVDVCSQCHPFYTGKQKVHKATGRVEKFNRKYGLSKNKKQEKQPEKSEKKSD